MKISQEVVYVKGSQLKNNNINTGKRATIILTQENTTEFNKSSKCFEVPNSTQGRKKKFN